MEATDLSVQKDLFVGQKSNIGFAIGSIQQSILTEEQFQNENGSQWVLWGASTDISGTKLADIIGSDTLPDATGRVFRNAGGNAAALGQVQDQETAVNGLELTSGNASGTFAATNHLHNQGSLFAAIGIDGTQTSAVRSNNTIVGQVYTESIAWYGGNGPYNPTYGVDVQGNVGSSTKSASVSYTPQSLSSGDTETRMINITMNTFIKVN